MEGTTIKTTRGNTYTFYRTTHDINGNPRYFISWLELGLEKYEANKDTRRAGLKKYTGRAFGGGYVLTSYSLHNEAEYLDTIFNRV